MLEELIQELVRELEKRGYLSNNTSSASSGVVAKTDTAKPASPPKVDKPAPSPDDKCIQVRDVWGDDVNSIELDVDVEYDPDSGQYTINGKKYPEKAAVWIPIALDDDFGCNLDPDQPICGSSFHQELIPPNSYRRGERGRTKAEFIQPKDEFGCTRDWLFPNEADLKYALTHCLEHEEPGFFIFCRDGKFHVLTEAHYYFDENDTDYLICIFNARRCNDGYRKTWATLNAEVCSLPLACYIRYVPGDFIAWDTKLVETLKDELRKGAYPYDDYDD